MTLEDLKSLQVKEIIHSAFRQLPETPLGPKIFAIPLITCASQFRS